ncbi:MAG: aspartate racemase [Cyclobacteriaceae bacterium]|jgi:aspartate racemase
MQETFENINYMRPNKRLGIVGGMGSMAGVLFAKMVTERSLAIKDQDFIETILHSNTRVPDRTTSILTNDNSIVGELKRSLEIFNNNQIDIIVLACITSYFYLDEIQKISNGTIINPIELVSKHLFEKYKGVKKVGLLSSTGTVKMKLFHKELIKYGVEVCVLPSDKQESLMKSIYMEGGLKSGVISKEALSLFNEAAEALIDKGIDCLIGGCSEINSELPSIPKTVPFLDTMGITADEIVDRCYKPTFSE